jgi:hypothetical protein
MHKRDVADRSGLAAASSRQPVQLVGRRPLTTRRPADARIVNDRAHRGNAASRQVENSERDCSMRGWCSGDGSCVDIDRFAEEVLADPVPCHEMLRETGSGHPRHRLGRIRWVPRWPSMPRGKSTLPPRASARSSCVPGSPASSARSSRRCWTPTVGPYGAARRPRRRAVVRRAVLASPPRLRTALRDARRRRGRRRGVAGRDRLAGR